MRQSHWVEDLCSHFIKEGNVYMRLIYVYKFSDNSVYVGLTYDINERSNQHMTNVNKSSVCNYSNKTNLIPELILLTDYIDVNEASKLEGDYLKIFKDEGYNILNKTKTGGIGGTTIKWTYEVCKIESAKYNIVTRLMENSIGCYKSILKNGWINEFYPNRRKSNKKGKL